MFGPGKILITSTSEDLEQKVLKISLKKTFVVSCHISKVFEKTRVESVEFTVLGVEVKTLKNAPQKAGKLLCPSSASQAGSLTSIP